MNILIAGASGFIGKELTKALSKNHHLTVLGRDMSRLEQSFPKNIDKLTWDTLERYDAKELDVVINLSGSNIGAKRWTESVKKEIIESRTSTNKKLVDWLINQEACPHYYCANAVGIYGAHDGNTASFDEDSPIKDESRNDFLTEIGIAWEQSLQPAIDRGIKVTTLRFAVVLKKGEGMLKKLELPFSLGLGSVIGSGSQMLSWVYYEDLVRAVDFLLAHPDITGPINVTAPNPIAQKEFATEFAATLNRPLFLKLPSFVVKALFGEMGSYLLLKGQHVVPKRLIELGFKFQYPTLSTALRKEYTNKKNIQTTSKH